MSANPNETQGNLQPETGWHVRHGGAKVFGPFDHAAIVRAAQSGKFNSHSEVMHPQETQSKWVAVHDVASIAPFLKQTPVSQAVTPQPTPSSSGQQAATAPVPTEDTSRQTQDKESKCNRNGLSILVAVCRGRRHAGRPLPLCTRPTPKPSRDSAERRVA